MKNLTKFIAILLVIAIGGLLTFLATWDIPTPSKNVEKVLDNDRFPR